MNTAVAHPQANGLVERQTEALWKEIKIHIGGKKAGYGEAVIPAEIGMPSYRTLMIREEFNEEEQRLNLDLLQERREAAAIEESSASQQKERTTTRSTPGGIFRPGECFVYRRNEASRVEDQGKLGPKWEGPYRVTEAFENGSYKLQTMEDKVVPRTWHAINLRKCYL
ncbi:reverse transcriptase domain-containing protein [Tanacetum coccineum]